MDKIYYKEDTINILDISKKVKDLTLEDLDKLYKAKILTLFKFITDDNYFIKLEEEKKTC